MRALFHFETNLASLHAKGKATFCILCYFWKTTKEVGCFCELPCILIAEQRKRKIQKSPTMQQCTHTYNVGSGFYLSIAVAKSISTHFPVTVCLTRSLHVCPSKSLRIHLQLDSYEVSWREEARSERNAG